MVMSRRPALEVQLRPPVAVAVHVRPFSQRAQRAWTGGEVERVEHRHDELRPGLRTRRLLVPGEEPLAGARSYLAPGGAGPASTTSSSGLRYIAATVTVTTFSTRSEPLSKACRLRVRRTDRSDHN